MLKHTLRERSRKGCDMRRVERQNSFFRRYMEGGKTVRQVMAEMRMKPTTLQRWCEDPAFKKRDDKGRQRR